MRTTLDRLYDEGFSRPWRILGSDTEASMPLEVSETDDAIEVKAQLPGVKAEDINITLSSGMLNIRAEHREDHDEKQKNFVRHEIRYGAMQRSISLPSGVDSNNVTATFDDGILRLKLPKSAEVMPKRIPISGSSGSQPQVGRQNETRAA
jgi:HSP20 family protein